MPYLSLKKASELLDVSVPSLRRWVDRGLVKSIRTPGGHRRIDLESLKAVVKPVGKGESVNSVEDDATDTADNSNDPFDLDGL